MAVHAFGTEMRATQHERRSRTVATVSYKIVDVIWVAVGAMVVELESMLSCILSAGGANHALFV